MIVLSDIQSARIRSVCVFDRAAYDCEPNLSDAGLDSSATEDDFETTSRKVR